MLTCHNAAIVFSAASKKPNVARLRKQSGEEEVPVAVNAETCPQRGRCEDRRLSPHMHSKATEDASGKQRMDYVTRFPMPTDAYSSDAAL